MVFQRVSVLALISASTWRAISGFQRASLDRPLKDRIQDLANEVRHENGNKLVSHPDRSKDRGMYGKQQTSINASASKPDKCACLRCGTTDSGTWTDPQYCPAGLSGMGHKCKMEGPSPNGCYSSLESYGCNCHGQGGGEPGAYYHIEGCEYESIDYCMSKTAACPWGTLNLDSSPQQCTNALENMNLPGQQQEVTVSDKLVNYTKGCFAHNSQGDQPVFNKVGLLDSVRNVNAVCAKVKMCPPTQGCAHQSSGFCVSYNADCPAGWDIISNAGMCTMALSDMNLDSATDEVQVAVYNTTLGGSPMSYYPKGCFGHGGAASGPWFNSLGRLHSDLNVNAICQRTVVEHNWGQMECINQGRFVTSAPTAPTARPTPLPTAPPTTASPTEYRPPAAAPTPRWTGSPTGSPTKRPTWAHLSCAPWCERDTRTTEKKCTFNACDGCNFCGGPEEKSAGTPGSQNCHTWCDNDTREWTKKCHFKNTCDGCHPCHPYRNHPQVVGPEAELVSKDDIEVPTSNTLRAHEESYWGS